MQIQIKPIHTGESRLWRCGEKQLIHGPRSKDGNGWFGGGGSWMGRNNQAHTRPARKQREIGTIEEGSLCPTLRVGRLGVWWLGETGRNRRQIEPSVLFAPHDDPQPRHEEIDEHGSSSIPSVQTDQDA